MSNSKFNIELDGVTITMVSSIVFSLLYCIVMSYLSSGPNKAKKEAYDICLDASKGKYTYYSAESIIDNCSTGSELIRSASYGMDDYPLDVFATCLKLNLDIDGRSQMHVLTDCAETYGESA